MFSTLPKYPLGFFPTPLHELTQLSVRLGGPRLLIKRDDQTGLALGGNKTRKLEFLIADALAQGCDTVITAGAAQSNHCRQTAAAAAQAGLNCHLVLGGAPPPAPTATSCWTPSWALTSIGPVTNAKGSPSPQWQKPYEVKLTIPT